MIQINLQNKSIPSLACSPLLCMQGRYLDNMEGRHLDNTSSSSLDENIYTHHVNSVNSIYELQSIINQLTIQKQKSYILYRNALNAHALDRASFQKQMVACQENEQALTARIDQMEIVIRSKDAEYEELRKSYEKLENVVDKLPASGASAILSAIAVDRAKKEHTAAQKECSRLQQLLRQCQGKVVDSKNQLASVKTKMESQLQKLKEQLELNQLAHNNQLNKLSIQFNSSNSSLKEQLKLLKQEQSKLQHDNSKKIEEICSLHRKINALQVEQLSMIPPSLQSRDTEYNQLVLRFENLIEEHNAVIKKERSLVKEVEGLRSLCCARQNEISILEQRLRNSPVEYRVTNFENTFEVTSSVQPLLAEITQLKYLLMTVEAERVQLGKRVEFVMKQKNASQESRMHTLREFEYLKESMRRQEQTLEGNEAKTQVLCHELQDERKLRVKFEGENEKLAQKVKDLSLGVQGLMRQRKVIECSKCFNTQTNTRNRMAQLERSNQQLSEANLALQRQISQLDQSVVSAIAQKYKAEQQAKQSREQNAASKINLNQLASEYDKLSKRYEWMSGETSNRILKHQETINELKELIEQLQKQLSKAPSLFQIHHPLRLTINPSKQTSIITKSPQSIPKQYGRLEVVRRQQDLGGMNLGDLEAIRPKARANTDRCRVNQKQDLDALIKNLKMENMMLAKRG